MSVALRRSLVIALLVAAGAACSKPNADEHAKKAEGYLAASQVPEAILELRSAVQADPKRGDLRLKLADLHVRQRELGLALGEYVRAADLLPNDVNAQVKAGGLLAMAGMFEDAKTRALKALALDPKNAEAQIILGNAHAGLKDLDAALSEYQEALALDPTSDAAYANIGAIQVSQGKIPEAEATFRKAVDVAPKSVNAHLALANLLWATGRAKDAEQTLKTALSLDPNNAVANRALGVFYLMSQRAPEAEPYFQTIARTANTAEARIGLADYYVMVKKYDDARKILQEVAQKDADYAVATIRLASVDAAEGNRAMAMVKLREVVGKHPKDMTARLLIARLLLIDGKRDEALAAANAIVKDEPTSTAAPAAYAMIGDIAAASDRTDEAISAYEEVLKRQPTSVQANVALAGLYLTTGSVDKAQSFAQQALTQQPRNPLVRVLMTRIGLARRQTQAQAELAALQKEYPNAPPVLNLVAAQQTIEKKYDLARATYQRSLQLAPNNLEALTGLSRIDILSGRSKDAVARVESGLKTTKPTASLLIMAAQTNASSGDWKRAEELLKQAIDLEPARLQAYALLGGLYTRQNRLDEARDQFRQVIERNPRSVPAHTMVGMLFEAQKRTPEAEESYQKALAIDPRAAVAANNLAWIYVASDRKLDEALQLAQTANQAAPDEPHINDTLGWIYCKKNMGSVAIPHLERSIKSDPSDPAVHYHLAVAYLQAGDSARARKSLETALGAKRDFDGIAEARAALAKLPR